MVDACLALSRCHRAVEHDGRDACATETPFDELEHSGELGENDGFRGHIFRAELVEIVD